MRLGHSSLLPYINLNLNALVQTDFRKIIQKNDFEGWFAARAIPDKTITAHAKIAAICVICKARCIHCVFLNGYRFIPSAYLTIKTDGANVSGGNYVYSG